MPVYSFDNLSCFTDYDLKACIKGGNSKITLSGVHTEVLISRLLVDFNPMQKSGRILSDLIHHYQAKNVRGILV
jgi:hypothetical protein